MNSVKTDITNKLLFYWSSKYNKLLISDAFINYWRQNSFAIYEALSVGLNDKQNEESN
jgi:hypothetical protein